MYVCIYVCLSVCIFVPGVGNGNPFQCSCLENPMDRGAWWTTVHGVAKSWTPLNNCIHIYLYVCIYVYTHLYKVDNFIFGMQSNIYRKFDIQSNNRGFLSPSLELNISRKPSC